MNKDIGNADRRALDPRAGMQEPGMVATRPIDAGGRPLGATIVRHEPDVKAQQARAEAQQMQAQVRQAVQQAPLERSESVAISAEEPPAAAPVQNVTEPRTLPAKALDRPSLRSVRIPRKLTHRKVIPATPSNAAPATPTTDGDDAREACDTWSPIDVRWPQIAPPHEGSDSSNEDPSETAWPYVKMPELDASNDCDARIKGLLRYIKWWYLRNGVGFSVNGELVCGMPIMLRDKTLRVVNKAHSYIIPMGNIDYIRTPDGLDMAQEEFG